MTEFVLSNDDMHSAEEIAHLKDLLGKANALARIRAERIKELEAQAGAEPAPSAVVCGRCDGTGLDARYCNYQCEKCDGSGQAGAEPVAWRGYTITNGYTLHHYYGEAHRVASQIEPLYTHPPARVPLTRQEPSAWDVLFAVEEAIRNGDCPWQIEQAFDEYEAKRRNSIKEGP